MTKLGLFDSGLGGLTVAREVVRQMPCADIEFYGDNGRNPYGPLPGSEILRYSRQILDFLSQKRIDLAIIACNTATAAALDEVKDSYPFAVLGVIEPGAQGAVKASRAKAIGVIATPFTVHSRAYEHAVSRIDPEVSVLAQACPAFTLLVESGAVDSPEASRAAKEYMAVFEHSGIDTLVLGCTHYPVLIDLVRQNLPETVKVIDPAVETVRLARSLLHDKYVLSESAGCVGKRNFYTSGDAELFERLGSSILGMATGKVRKVTFD